jgi:site-specific DNA-methyltransferase (adenine-specific)
MNSISTFKNEKKIFLGDAITVLNEYIEDESIDLIFVDPPYNIGKKFPNFQDK